jgi:hypothetical protein
LKKSHKISLVIVGFVLASVIVFYYARNVILINIFEKLVSQESKHKVSLKIDGLHFDVIRNDLTIDSMSFVFNMSNADSIDKIRIEKLAFSEIALNKLNVKSLLFDKIFDARSLIVKHPFVRFVAANTTGGKKEVTDPQKIFKFLEGSSVNNYGVLIKLDTLEIKYGNIRVNKHKTDQKDLTISDLTLILNDFNTTVGDSVYVYGRMFFAKSLFVSADGVYKSLDPGYDLYVDSISWRSDDYTLDAHGFRLNPAPSLPDDMSLTKVNVAALHLDDFHLLSVDSISSIKVKKVHVDNGNIDVYFRKSNKTKKKPSEVKSPLFRTITVDTLALERIKMYFHARTGDTMLYFKNMSAYVEDLKFDSLLNTVPEKSFDYSRFKLKASSFVANSLVKGYGIHNRDFEYNNKYKLIVFNGLEITEDNKAFISRVGQLRLNMSMKKLFRKQQQEVNIQIIEPDIKIDLRKDLFEGKSPAQKKSNGNALAFLKPGHIDVVGGDLTLITKEDDSLSIKGLRFITRNLVYKKDSIFSYEKLFASATRLDFDKKDKYRFSLSGFTLDDSGLNVNNVAYHGKQGVLKSFSNERLKITAFDLEDVLIRKTLHADTVLLVNSTEYVVIPENSDDTTAKTPFSIPELVKEVEKDLGFKADLGYLGIINNKFSLSQDSAAIKDLEVNVDLTWHDLKFGGINDRPLSDLRELDLILTDVKYSMHETSVNLDTLLINSQDSLVRFMDLSLKNIPDTARKIKSLIHDITIRNITLNNFDFNSLLTKNNFYFGKLVIDSVLVDVDQFGRKKTEKKKRIEPFDINLKNKIPFAFLMDTIELNNFFLRAKTKDSSAVIDYRLHDLSLTYSPDALKNEEELNFGTIINDLQFYFDSLIINDTSKGEKVIVERGYLNNNPHELVFSNVFINTVKKEDDNSSGIIARTGNIKFNNINSTDTLPLLVTVKELNFSDVDLKITAKKKNKAKASDTLLKMAGLYKFSKLFDGLVIDTIAFSNMDLQYKGSDSLNKGFSVDNLQLYLTNFNIYPSKALNTVPVNIGNINAILYNREFVSGDSLYKFKAKKLTYNSYNHSLVVDSFYVQPRYDTLEFFKRHKWQTDRISIFVKQFSLDGFDVDRWNRESFLHLDHINVDGLIANLYRDKNFPRDTTVIKPLIQDMLRSVNKPFRIDSVLINNAYLRYSELGEKSFKPGYVYFTEGNLKAFDITNSPIEGKGETLKVSLNMKLMGDGKINGNFYFPLEQGSQFYFNAKSEKLDLTLLNPMTQNLLGMTIASGKGKLDIPLITANDDLATGYLLFRYRMKMQLYNRKKAEKNSKKGVTSPLMNFIINGLVVKNRNPNLFNKPRVGVVYFERDKNKAIPNYIWKSTLSGVLSTMGFNNKQQRKERKAYKKSDFNNMRDMMMRDEKQKKNGKKSRKRKKK